MHSQIKNRVTILFVTDGLNEKAITDKVNELHKSLYTYELTVVLTDSKTLEIDCNTATYKSFNNFVYQCKDCLTNLLNRFSKPIKATKDVVFIVGSSSQLDSIYTEGVLEALTIYDQDLIVNFDFSYIQATNALTIKDKLKSIIHAKVLKSDTTEQTGLPNAIALSYNYFSTFFKKGLPRYAQEYKMVV
jgi:hypothetical protein